MKHSKANTIPPPVFVNNKGLHGLTPISEDTELSKVCGGIYTSEFEPWQLILPFMGLTGLDRLQWSPGALITSIPFVAALMVVPALITRKVTKSKYDKKLKEKTDLIKKYITNS